MKHFLPVFKALDVDGIRYVTVGGIATVLNGYPRLTGDVDIVLDLADRDGCAKALEQLGKLGMRPRAPVNLAEFADPEKRKSWIEEKGMAVFTMSSPQLPLIEVDLFVAEPMPFERLYSNSKVLLIEEVRVRICSIDDLIEMKKKVSRPRDLDDIENLLLIKENSVDYGKK